MVTAVVVGAIVLLVLGIVDGKSEGVVVPVELVMRGVDVTIFVLSVVGKAVVAGSVLKVVLEKSLVVGVVVDWPVVVGAVGSPVVGVGAEESLFIRIVVDL